MADKEKGGTTATGPVVTAPGRVRNVVLVGHAGAGKTTLVEALLAATGTIGRAGRVEDGTTVTDADEAETRQSRSVALALAPLEHAGVKVNLLDAPGHPDFVGELRAGLRAADAALFVVSATDGIDGGTQLLWEECAHLGMPRAVVITHLDSPRAEADEVIGQCQRAFGEGVLPAYLPMHNDDGSVAGLIGLLGRRIADYSTAARVERDPDPEHLPLIADARAALIEGIITESEDETLMDRYLGGEDIDPKVLVDDLETAVSRGHFFPVLMAACPPGGPTIGTAEILELLTSAFPTPLEHLLPALYQPDGTPYDPLPCDPQGPLVAEVVKTSTDPYLGRICLVRVFSGTLRPDTPVHVAGHGHAEWQRTGGHDDHDADERVGALSSPLGATPRPVPCCVAGDICALAKVGSAQAGDTISGRDEPLVAAPWEMPEPLLPVAIAAHSRSDEDRLSQGLSRLVADDPTLRLDHNVDTGQLVLWCMGQAHGDVQLDRLRRRYGVAVDRVAVRVPLRETFGEAARGHGRHVKQSGGHGQYAICDVVVEPLPVGAGFEFVDEVVGGAVPRQFIPSVAKGVRTQLDKGVAAGFPVVDVRVRLVDGKAHSVDSSDMAFQMAGGLALKEAAAATTVQLLEPVLDVGVLVPDDHVGTVLGDLSARRGRVSGTEPVGAGRTLVRAEVPETELLSYAVELRALTAGTGTFTRRYSRHEPMPRALADAELRRAAGV